jgi:hypothetical protein
MITINSKKYDTIIYKKALSKLLKRKDYHQAPPTKKNVMFMKEYNKILDKLKRA